MTPCPCNLLLVFPDDHGTPTIACEREAGHDGPHVLTYRLPFHLNDGKRTEFRESVVRIEWESVEAE